MKKLFVCVLALAVCGLGINTLNKFYSPVTAEISVKNEEETVSSENSEAKPESATENAKEEKIISVRDGENMMEMTVSDYLKCVVAGEVSPKNDIEALKAQAVAARTYLFHKIEGGGCAKGGDICTDYAHCQAFKSVEKMKTGWQDKFDEYFAKISEAVDGTKDEVILYSGSPICALYHSSSNEKTEDCVSVFGGNYPYLVSVVSPEEASEDKRQTFSKEEFCEKVNSSFSLALTSFDISVSSRTPAGRVSTVSLGGKEVKATALRSCLMLRSTDFEFETDAHSISFICHGYGHGVGMSQAGAAVLAESGKNYKEILTHYYSGVSIEKYFLE